MTRIDKNKTYRTRTDLLEEINSLAADNARLAVNYALLEHRTIDEVMVPASRYWEARWRNEASELDRLKAENARLREALEPVASAADGFDRMPIRDAEQWFAYSGEKSSNGNIGALTVGDLRRARAALKGGE